MSKKKSKAKKAKAQKALQARKTQAKAQNVSRLLTITIMGALSWFVYQDVKAESLEGTQSPYSDSEFLAELHEIDEVLEELQQAYPEATQPQMIQVCWSASQQRLVPAYMAETECGS